MVDDEYFSVEEIMRIKKVFVRIFSEMWWNALKQEIENIK